jgi:hypothetical protein
MGECGLGSRRSVMALNNCCPSRRYFVAGDGVFSIFHNGRIQLVDLKSNTTTDLVSVMDIKDVSAFFSKVIVCIEFRTTQDEGNMILWQDWKLSPDMTYILVKADYVKVKIFHEHRFEMLKYNF